MTHLHFFFQDIVSGKRPTTIQIASPNKPYEMGFGALRMADDPITVGPDRRSKIVGQAQGLYGFSSQEEFSLLMVMNYVFTNGKYNGSSIAILGRNPPMQYVREMPIVGGTGLFRLARGYALAHTVWSSPQGDATVEYHVYVYHF
ncbi:Dirigent protein 21 [Bienertia sinuspersici]